MASYSIQDTTLTAIANAIRTKDGTSSPIATEDMATKILAIPTSSGGGTLTPEYTEEKIADNSGLSTTITFTKDYHNYQMLRVVLYNSNRKKYESQFIVPEGIDKSFLYSTNHFAVNQLDDDSYTNQYATYDETSALVWTRSARRNVDIYEIYGMTFVKTTLTKTVLYSRDAAVSSSNVTPEPPSGKTFFDYDAIMYMTCSSDVQVTRFAKHWFAPQICSMNPQSVLTYHSTYNGGSGVVLTPSSIGSKTYFYVVGLKFT